PNSLRPTLRASFGEDLPDAQDAARTPRLVVDVYDRSLQHRLALGRLERGVSRREEPLDRGLLAQPDDAVPRAAHADVGLVRRSAVQDAFVGGLDVRVGPEHRRDTAVEKMPHGILLARRLAVHVDEDAGRLLAQPLDEPLLGAERAVERLHEDASFQVDDA